MCFHFKQSKSATALENRFKAQFEFAGYYKSGEHYNGFAHPYAPIITRETPGLISLYQWGLMPHWAKDGKIQKSTLNARIETLAEKPSFKFACQDNQRCLILVDGFYEWQAIEGEKKKRKYLIDMADEAFALAGLYNKWVDKNTGEVIPTFTIITQPASEAMLPIHSRMPVILPPDHETRWLESGDAPNPPAIKISSS